MAVIRHQKHSLSAGLSWNQLTQKNYKAEAINLSEHESRPFGSIYRVKGEDGTNSFVGLTKAKSDVGNISAAAIFATICENGMIVDSISEKSAWWCASSNNQVLTQTDRVYDKDELTSEENGLLIFIEEALPQIVEAGSADFKIYAAPDLAELIQDLVGEIEVVTMTLSDLITDSGLKFPSTFSKYRVKKVSGSSPLVLLSLAVIMIGAGYYFFVYEPAPQSVEMDMSGLSSLKTANESVNKIVKKVPPSERDKEILAKAMEEEKEWLLDDLNAKTMSGIAEEVFNVYRALPLYSAGWNLTTISYRSAENTDLIATIWHKDFGTPSDFRSYWERIGLDFEIAMDGKTGFVYFPLSLDQLIKGDTEELYRKYKDSTFDSIELMSALDRHSFVWTMNRKPEMGRREVIEGLYNQDLSDVKQLPIDVTGFEITGRDSVAGYHSAIDLAGLSNLLLAEEITIDLTNGFDWIIKGELYNVK